MATRPLPEPAESTAAGYAQEHLREPVREYIKEVHEFLATSRVPFGTPVDLAGVAARLAEPGAFAEDLASLVRSMVLRQGGAMPHAELLEILALAIAGPEMMRSPQLYQEQFRQLLGFVTGAMRRPWNVPPTVSAEVVPFPTDTASEAEESLAPTDADAVADRAVSQVPANQDPTGANELILAQPSEDPKPAHADASTPRSPIPIRQASAIGVALAEKRVEASHADADPSPQSSLGLPGPAPDSPLDPTPPLTAPSPGSESTSSEWKLRRRLPIALAAAAIVVIAAASAALLVRAHPWPNTQSSLSGTQPGLTNAQPAPVIAGASRSPIYQSPARNYTPPAGSGRNAQPVYPPKPSPYGYAPALRQRQPQISGWAYAQANTPSSQRSAPFARASGAVAPQTTDFAPIARSTPAPAAATAIPPATAYAPYSQQNGSQAPAPIVRRAPVNPDAYIVGEMPAGARAPQSQVAQPAYFTVSSGVMAANLIFAPDPEYPAFARLAHIQGQVILQAVVSRDGTVSATRVLRGNRLLRGAAEEAVRRWRYRPFRLAGRPVDVATIVTVDFHDHS